LGGRVLFFGLGVEGGLSDPRLNKEDPQVMSKTKQPDSKRQVLTIQHSAREQSSSFPPLPQSSLTIETKTFAPSHISSPPQRSE